MKKIIIFTAITLFSLSMFAELSGGMGGPQFGFYKMDYTGLNNILRNNTGGEVPEIKYDMGGCGYALIDGFMIGGYGWGAEGTIATDSLSIHHSIGGGAFEFGRLWDVNFMHIGILGKLGSFGETMKLTPKPLVNVSIDDLINDPARVSEITRGGFETGLSIMTIVPLKKWISISLKGGVSYGLGWNWALTDGGDILNAPQDQPLRYNVSLGVLFGMAAE